MNNKISFLERIKLLIRNYLISAAKRLGEEKPKGPAIRNAKNLLSKEIKIPRAFSAVAAALMMSFMLSTHFGLGYKAILSVIIFMCGIIYFFLIQTKGKEKEIFTDNDAVVLICLLFTIALFILQLSEKYLNTMAFPVSAFVVMSAMLLSFRIGFLYALILSLFAAFIGGMCFELFFVMLCGSIAAMSGVKKIRKRSDFTSVFLRVAIVNIIVITMFFLLNVYGVQAYQRNLFYAILNAIFAVILILAMMPFFETFFSRTTSIKLIELADFNNPLLKRLMLEAPGTYHHSLMTAAIAEKAADAIGANSLLARVGAYYHDIGKLTAPEYFIENQGSNANPHDPLTPTMSSLILVSHIKDGVALAKKYNLDKSIIDSIEQHHGTTTIHFFYHKALELKKDTRMENFRYPGPKPRTKVAAIIMIADSSEAACRALDDPTAVRIKETVEKIINNKFTDAQFSECPITLKDLQAIGDSIISSLIGIHHARIEYKETESR
ncbi:MAG: HDIG domain-containing protein [Endomicrobium sp.]|jgi:putative nucleotidyltransferase with HDIG domain|nr:HDIG domain-containing protein [Endomicrobium sp.]